jgi:hypothetical protein
LCVHGGQTPDRLGDLGVQLCRATADLGGTHFSDIAAVTPDDGWHTGHGRSA